MPPIEDYGSHDALGLAALVASGDVTPSELLEAALDRASRVEPKIHSIPIPLEAEARDTIERGLPAGPFRGVPFLVKDLHAHIVGARLTNGSRLFADAVSTCDSEIVTRYRRAGLVIFGRSASPEFGITTSTESLLFGETRNPWNLDHTSGGSSGGASAAVAAGIVPSANASDGGGSIRIPASCTGLFGLKPTRARVPAGPLVGEGWSGMSTAHAVTRSVRDSAALLDAVAGPAEGDPYFAPPPERPFLEEVGRPPGRLRVAFQAKSFNGAETHPDCVEALESATKLCEDLGHRVEETDLTVDAAAIRVATGAIIAANLRATLLDRAAELGRELREDDVEPVTWLMAQGAAGTEAAEYARAVRVVHGVGRQVEAFFRHYDVLLTPTMAVPPQKIGALALTNDPRTFIENLVPTTAYTQLFNVTGQPAASVPLHWNESGLPVGVQVGARFGDEATILRLAAQLEEARPWFARRPPL